MGKQMPFSNAIIDYYLIGNSVGLRKLKIPENLLPMYKIVGTLISTSS